MAALEGPDAPTLLPPRGILDAPPDTVILSYRLDSASERRITCRFAPRGSSDDPLALVGVHTDHDGELSPASLFFLRTYVLERPPLLPDLPSTAASAPGTLAYFLQQLVNALTPAAIYALLATGYALIYGITDRINLAFGDFTTVGALITVQGMLLGSLLLGFSLAAGAPLALLLAIAAGAALGLVLHALVFAPLQRRGAQALLIATIGLSIALSEALRLVTGSRQSWLPPFLEQPVTLLRATGGEVGVGLGSALLALLALATVVGVILTLRWSAFGRRYRACADDPGAAALMGVDVDRTLRDACVVGSALAGIAGFIVAGRYGLATFGMGTLWGFKALAAAIVGGIGSVSGAALGGLLIGLLEGLWAAYLPSGYREVAVFVLLAVVLALRPNGLFGQAAAADNPALWRERQNS